MNREELEERQLEIANRMKNIIWTVCGDYTLEAKPDVEAFLKSKYIALYDGIKQGAFAKYFEKEKLSMYLVKKVYLGAREDALVAIAQLCMEKAVGDRIARERKGVSSIQKKAYEYVLDHEMDMLVKSEFGRLQLAMMRQVLTGERRCEEKIRKQLDRIEPLEKAADTMEVIRTIDDCYNAWVDPGFEQIHGDLSKVLAVTVEELMEYSWQDFLTEDMYEENFEAYLEQMSQQMTATGQNHAEEKKDEKESSKKRKIVRVSEEDLKKEGIGLIVSPFANSNLDVPAMPKETYALIAERGECGVLDIGGDDRGALALGRYVPEIRAEGDYEMLFVINRARPLTRTVADTILVLREIEAACGLPFTAVVNNTNLGQATAAADVLSSMPYAEAVAARAGLPLKMTCCAARLCDALRGSIPNLFPMEIQKLYYQLYAHAGRERKGHWRAFFRL
mgnify:CR=1 FL=1